MVIEFFIDDKNLNLLTNKQRGFLRIKIIAEGGEKETVESISFVLVGIKRLIVKVTLAGIESDLVLERKKDQNRFGFSLILSSRYLMYSLNFDSFRSRLNFSQMVGLPDFLLANSTASYMYRYLHSS